MSDLERLVEFLEKSTIEFEHHHDQVLQDVDGKVDSIHITSGMGYCGFFAEFFFDKQGKFVNHGIWE